MDALLFKRTPQTRLALLDRSSAMEWRGPWLLLVSLPEEPLKVVNLEVWDSEIPVFEDMYDTYVQWMYADVVTFMQIVFFNVEMIPFSCWMVWYQKLDNGHFVSSTQVSIYLGQSTRCFFCQVSLLHCITLYQLFPELHHQGFLSLAQSTYSSISKPQFNPTHKINQSSQHHRGRHQLVNTFILSVLALLGSLAILCIITTHHIGAIIRTIVFVYPMHLLKGCDAFPHT